MADGKDIDFTPYVSGDDTPTSAATPAPAAPPTQIDFSKYATPATPTTSASDIDFSQYAKPATAATPAASGWWTPDRYSQAVSHLQQNAGLSPYGAQALAARWAGVESTGQGPSSVNPTTGAYGIAQWLGTRKNGVPSDFTGQLNHAVGELNGTESAAAKRLRNAQTPEDAAIGAAMYERAEGYDPTTGRDNFVQPTLHTMQRFGTPTIDAPVADTTPQPSTIQPRAPAQTPQITPEEQQAFDAQFPVEQYSPGYVDPNVPTPEQNAQNLYDASNELTAIGQAAAKGEKYVDPATQLVLEGGYKQAPDQTNVPQGTTRMVKDGQNYLTKQIGNNYSIAPENQAQKVAPTSPADPQYQEYLKAGGETDSSATRQKFAQIMQGVQATTDKLNAQTANPNVQRLMTRFQPSSAPLDDVHFRNTEIPYLITIPDGVNKEQYAKDAANQQLQNKWGLTPEQAAKFNWKVPPLEKGQNQVVAYIRRGDLVDAVGMDKVKADYYGEMPPQGLNPLENEQKAAAQPLTDNPFVRPSGNPLMDQAKANVMANPFSEGTDDAVQKEYERLQRTTPGEDEKYATNEIGKFLTNVDATGAQTGLVKGAAWLGDIVTGAVKLSPIGLLDYVTGTHVADIGSRVSNDARLVAKSSSDHDTFIYEIGGQQIRPRAMGEAIGQAAVQVPVYVALSELPGGVTMAMAATEGLGSVGRGNNALEVGGNTIKGGALGTLFSVAPRVGQFAEELAGRAMVNPVFEAGQNLSTGQILASKLIGTTAELGTIGGGTFAVEKASGASNKDALNSAIVNTLFGLTKYVPLDSMVGKTYRMHDGTTTTDVTVDPDGSVKLLKGNVPPGAVDAEFDVSKVVDMKPDASGVYRAEGDSAEAQKAGAPIARLGEAPAKRIDTPLPDAVQRIPLDTRAQKIGGALSDGQPMTIEEIAKATKYNPAKVNETLTTLYGAGKIEILPDGRVRLIEPLNQGTTSLYDQFDDKGRVTPVSSEQATGKTAPVASPSGIAPTVTENGNAPEATTEKSADKTTTPVAPTYKPEEFGLPFIDSAVPRNRLSLQKEIEVKYETPSGNSFTKRMSVEDRQRQIQQKHSVLEKLLDCING